MLAPAGLIPPNAKDQQMDKADKDRAEDKRDDAAEKERRKIYEVRKAKIVEIDRDTTEQLRRQKDAVDEAKSKPVAPPDVDHAE